MVDQIRFFAGAARMLEGKAAAEYMAGHTSWVRREPIGVVGQVTPWNYPMMMAVWKIAPAIAAGNTVVLKPSDTTPVTTLRLAELAAEFLPAGRAQRRLRRPRHRPRAGRAPRPRSWSRSPGRCGPACRSPRRRAATSSGCTWSSAARRRSSSSTTPTSRPRRRPSPSPATSTPARTAPPPPACWPRPGIHDDFVAALTEQARSTPTTYANGAGDEDALVPPVNNANQLAHVTGFLDRAPDHAEVTAGGHRQGDRGFFVEPTVVAGLRQDDEMVQNEIFGPVITVQRFTDEDEAMRWANGVELRAGLERLDEATSAGPCG